ncbi:MAG: hypothetical protein KDA87_18165, partial [Planctomycetales bacterium]|nr:hypothetical protein [Planctomycetales bacterium]
VSFAFRHQMCIVARVSTDAWASERHFHLIKLAEAVDADRQFSLANLLARMQGMGIPPSKQHALYPSQSSASIENSHVHVASSTKKLRHDKRL